MRTNHNFLKAHSLKDGIPLIDFHIHTWYSDGKSSIAEYVDAAARRGYAGICFTDHVDFTTGWFRAYADEISQNKKTAGDLEIYRGIEVRAGDRDGGLNAPAEIVDEAEVVIGVVHSIPSEDGKGKQAPSDFPRERLLEIEFEISLNLLGNDRVSVLGHPMSNYEKLYGPVPEGYYREIIAKAKATGRAIEINAKYKNDFAGFLRMCLEADPFVSLGSDAHSLSELGAIGVKINKGMSA